MLKCDNNLVIDVIFNKNFDGEFCIDNELVSTERLKKYILNINSDQYKLKVFFEKSLRLKKFLEL